MAAQAWCNTCRDDADMAGPVVNCAVANGCLRVIGDCAVCGRRISRIVTVAQTEGIPQEQYSAVELSERIMVAWQARRARLAAKRTVIMARLRAVGWDSREIGWLVGLVPEYVRKVLRYVELNEDPPPGFVPRGRAFRTKPGRVRRQRRTGGRHFK